MKNISQQILLLTILLLSGNCYAATDSLPACINTMKISTESSVTEYEYKGQRWFVFTKIIPPVEPNVSDKMTITKFYNDSCRLACTWTKGGIAGLNRVMPDTIEKEKIKNIAEPLLPQTIEKLATAKSALSIEQYTYQGKLLYRLIQLPLTANQLAAKGIKVIDEPYYNEQGTIIILFKRATSGSFLRAQRWEPASVKPADVTKTKHGWKRNSTGYMYQSTGK